MSYHFRRHLAIIEWIGQWIRFALELVLYPVYLVLLFLYKVVVAFVEHFVVFVINLSIEISSISREVFCHNGPVDILKRVSRHFKNLWKV